MRFRFVLLTLFMLGACGVAAGCAPSASSEEPSRTAATLTDAGFLTKSLWNDGQAEVAFYRVTRSENQYGEAQEQQFLVGTYLVKHRFNAEAMSKAGQATGDAAGADATDAFKYALFYELESGSYQFKRHWVTNARQRDLRPLKASLSSFDWCSNLYEELAFPPGEATRYLKRSDDYGNTERTFARQSGAFPAHMLPLLVRGLDFSEQRERSFAVVLPSGTPVQVQARLAGSDSLDLPMGRQTAERITVTYDQPVPSMIAEETSTQETYWRGTGPGRRLLQVKGAGYRMTLEEALRSPYWEENVWNRLARVEERP